MSTKKDTARIKKILHDDAVIDVLQGHEASEVLLSNNVTETLNNLNNNLTQNRKNVNSIIDEPLEKDEGPSSDKDMDLKALFLITEFQRASIGTMRESISRLNDMFERLLTVVERLQSDFERSQNKKVTSSKKGID
jgi:archaellum component FlaC